jgi:hypothetical protein
MQTKKMYNSKACEDLEEEERDDQVPDNPVEFLNRQPLLYQDTWHKLDSTESRNDQAEHAVRRGEELLAVRSSDLQAEEKRPDNDPGKNGGSRFMQEWPGPQVQEW